MRNGAYLLGSSWLATGLRAAYVVILARALGPADYGLISSTQALYLMLVAAAAAGLPAYLSRERAKDRTWWQESVYFSMIVQFATLSLGAAAFLLLGLATENDPVVRHVFLLFAATIVARGLSQWARHSAVAFEASHYQLRLVSVFRTGEVLAVAGLLALGGGVFAVAVIHLVSWVLEAATALALVHRRIAALRIRRPNWTRFRAAAGGILAISMALAAGEWLRIAPLALVRYIAWDAPDVGQFAVAWNAALIVSMMAVTVMHAAFPVVSRARARGDGSDAGYLDFCIRYGALFGTAAVIAGMAFGPWAITAAAGAEYARAGAIFTAALVLLGPIVMSYALDQTLFFEGRTGLIFLLNAAGLAVVVAGFVPVFRVFGPTGAVLAVFAAVALIVLVKITVIRAVAGMVLFPSLLRAAVASAVALAAAVPLMAVSAGAGLASGLAALLSAALMSKAIAPRERRALLAIVRRRRPSRAGK